MNLLEKIRNRNDHEKNAIALTTAAIVTFFIFLFWIYNIGSSSSGQKKNTELSDISPMSFFEENLSKTMISIKQFPTAVSEMTNTANLDSTSSIATTTSTNEGVLTTESAPQQ